MALLAVLSQFRSGAARPPLSMYGELVGVRAVLSLTTNPTANDVAHAVDIPPDHVPVYAALDATDLDTNGAPTIAISLGVMNAGLTDLSSTWISASTLAQAGTAAPATALTALPATVRSPNAATVVGVKFTTASATFASGTLGVSVFYRRVDQSGN